MPEPAPPTKRRAMTQARRLRIWTRDNGKCGECGCDVPLAWTVLDHRTPLELTGADDDANLWMLCEPCNRVKTAKDAADIAHARRLRKKNDPATRKASTLKGPKFVRHAVYRSVDGKVRPRKC